MLIVSMYVDDLIFIGNVEYMFSRFKQPMDKMFPMVDLGRMGDFINLEVKQDN